MGGGDGSDIESTVHKRADMGNQTLFVDLAFGVAWGHDCRSADESEFLISCRLRLQRALLGNALNIAEGEKSAQTVFFVHDKKFVDADVLGKKSIGASDGVGTEFVLANRENSGAGHHSLGHAAWSEARTDAVTREKTEQAVLRIHDGKGREAEFFLFD